MATTALLMRLSLLRVKPWLPPSPKLRYGLQCQIRGSRFQIQKTMDQHRTMPVARPIQHRPSASFVFRYPMGSLLCLKRGSNCGTASWLLAGNSDGRNV
jgi:hypothetical protein